jgi:preprotein translocase subunit SecG
MTLAIAQIIVSALIVILILLQERSGGLSSVFGGDSGGVYQTRRGMEKTIFRATIVLAVVFVGLAVWQLLL